MKTRAQSLFNIIYEKKILLLIAFGLTILGASYSTQFDNVYMKFVVVIFGLSIFPILLIGKKLEWVCFAVIMAFGSFFVIFSPVFDVLDEPAHYARSEYLSEGNLILQNDNEKLSFSKDYETLAKMMGYTGMNRLEPKVNFFHSELFSKKHNPEKQVETKVKATRPYSTLSYIPSALGLFIGKIISNGNLGVMFYLGRFFNLLMYALMAFVAIRMSGRWKLLVGFFAVQHLPIYISASFSQDAFFYGLSLLIFAKFIQLFDKEELIDIRDVLEITILSVLMIFSKLPNIMLIGLMLFIPMKRYKNKKIYALNFVGILVVIFIGLLWMKSYSSIEPTDLPSKVNSGDQISFILSNPKSFFQTLMISLMGSASKLSQYFTFGWYHKYSDLAYLSYLPLLGVMLFMYPVKLRHKINGWFKFAVIGVTLGVIILTNVIMYLSFTDVGAKVMNGVQGRYFYGVFILLPFVFNLSHLFFKEDSSGNLSYFNEEKFNRIIMMASICSLIWMCTMRIGAYY